MIAQNELSRISLPIPHPREIIMQTREDLYAVARCTLLLLLLLRRLLFLLIRRDLWLAAAAAGRQGLMRIHVTGLQNARGGGKRRLWLVEASDLCYEEGRGCPLSFRAKGKMPHPC